MPQVFQLLPAASQDVYYQEVGSEMEEIEFKPTILIMGCGYRRQLLNHYDTCMPFLDSLNVSSLKYCFKYLAINFHLRMKIYVHKTFMSTDALAQHKLTHHSNCIL